MQRVHYGILYIQLCIAMRILINFARGTLQWLFKDRSQNVKEKGNNILNKIQRPYMKMVDFRTFQEIRVSAKLS